MTTITARSTVTKDFLTSVGEMDQDDLTKTPWGNDYTKMDVIKQ